MARRAVKKSAYRPARRPARRGKRRFAGAAKSRRPSVQTIKIVVEGPGSVIGAAPELPAGRIAVDRKQRSRF